VGDNRIKLVYVAGVGRSGSTLLARLLGELEGFCNAGEAARTFFGPAARARDLPCSCGERPFRCVFWKDIVASLDGGARVAAASLLRLRHLAWVMSPVKPPTLRKKLDEHLFALQALYSDIASRSGCRVVVDSSKSPVIAFLLSQVPTIELSVVHLVRDPRAIISSRARPKEYLRALSPARVVPLWWVLNLASEMLRWVASSYRLIRYEDLLEEPRERLEMIGSEALGEAVEAGFVTGAHAVIRPQHALAGNPDKFETGRVAIEQRAWSLPAHVRRLVWLSTLPLFYRYGYSEASLFRDQRKVEKAV
jgi:hypothetical protein